MVPGSTTVVVFIPILKKKYQLAKKWYLIAHQTYWEILRHRILSQTPGLNKGLICEAPPEDKERNLPDILTSLRALHTINDAQTNDIRRHGLQKFTVSSALTQYC
jgi:hypothetical protein